MGICASVDASDYEYGCLEDVVYLQEYGNHLEKKVGSLHSQQGTKGLNQDAAILYQGYGMKDGAFCGVFDGHGKNGHFVSKVARNQLPTFLLSQKNVLAKTNAAVPNEGKTDAAENSMMNNEFLQWKEACISAFKVMDKQIELLDTVDCSVSGSTAVVVIKQGEDLVIANLGDSRAVLGTMTEAGISATQLTSDLKPSLPDEAARIKKLNGRVFALKQEPHIQRVWLPHEDSPGLAMSRAFGDYDLKEHGIIAIPDVSHHLLTSKDHFVVLATDGVWDVLSNEEVVSIISAANNEEKAAKAVIDEARAAWKCKFPTSRIDDCTVVCLFLQKRSGQQNQLSLKT
ncbi:hypothetical protein Ancab_002035 [Ancistrocladus abbreviatus]